MQMESECTINLPFFLFGSNKTSVTLKKEISSSQFQELLSKASTSQSLSGLVAHLFANILNNGKNWKSSKLDTSLKLGIYLAYEVPLI